MRGLRDEGTERLGEENDLSQDSNIGFLHKSCFMVNLKILLTRKINFVEVEIICPSRQITNVCTKKIKGMEYGRVAKEVNR